MLRWGETTCLNCGHKTGLFFIPQVIYLQTGVDKAKYVQTDTDKGKLLIRIPELFGNFASKNHLVAKQEEHGEESSILPMKYIFHFRRVL
jgi:hypothetical protein